MMANKPSRISSRLTLKPLASGGSQSEGGKGWVPLVEPMPGRLPRAQHQVDRQAAGDEVEPQTAEDLVDVAVQLEHAGQQRPKRSAEHGGQRGQHKRHGRGHRALQRRASRRWRRWRPGRSGLRCRYSTGRPRRSASRPGRAEQHGRPGRQHVGQLVRGPRHDARARRSGGRRPAGEAPMTTSTRALRANAATMPATRAGAQSIACRAQL